MHLADVNESTSHKTVCLEILVHLHKNVELHWCARTGMANWWVAVSFYVARGKVSRMCMIRLLGRLLSKCAKLSDLRSKPSLIIAYSILPCNFLFSNSNYLAIYVISGQTATNDHFVHVL
jgi:hypothetical protein